MKDEYKGELFKDVVAALERAGHRMCVLRGYESYPERIGSDVDAISENPTQIPRILSEQKVATIVRTSQYTNKYIYVLYRKRGNESVFLNLDVSADYRYYGRLFYSGEEFLRTCRSFKFFKVPSAELEFGAYLIKHVTGRSLDEVKSRRLTKLYEENPAGCERQTARFFPEAETKLIVESARSRNWGPVLGRIEHLRWELLKETRREQWLSLLLHHLRFPRRYLETILWPAGLMVALLGPDGAGKSTVMTRIERDLSPMFAHTKSYHQRPLASARRWLERLPFRQKGEVKHITDSHAQRPRNLIASLTKLGFLWVDFTLLGYIKDILPQLVRPTLVLFDRYYYDLLVYPERYRYGGPLWLVQFVGWFIPRPHLVILLDAPPEVVQARRQEVSFEETARQREAYKKLVRGLPNGHIVDSSKPPDEVAARAEQIVLDHMAERVTRGLKP